MKPLAVILAIALVSPAHAQMQFGGAMAAGSSIGANPDQRSGPYPAAGDSSGGNTMSPANTLGIGQVMPSGGTGDSDTAVGPAAKPLPPAKPSVSSK
jgi:hypothetical protein